MSAPTHDFALTRLDGTLNLHSVILALLIGGVTILFWFFAVFGVVRLVDILEQDVSQELVCATDPIPGPSRTQRSGERTRGACEIASGSRFVDPADAGHQAAGNASLG